jgi:hypothetical protein
MDGQIANGKPLTDKELQEHQRQQQEQQERVKQRAEALVRKIGETCDELDRLAEENPELVGRVAVGSEEHKEAYLRLKARLQLADQAPRCRWVRQDGTTCGSPQMKRHIYCFAHAQMLEAQALALRLPAMEDANAIQIGLMRIQKALLEDTISTKKAGLMLYSMQLALQNVGQTTFGKVKAGEMVTETVGVEQAVREDLAIGRSGDRDIPPQPTQNRRGPGAPEIGTSENQQQNQNPAQSKTLPLMNADHADNQGLEEEFVAVPGGGYRFTGTPLWIDPWNRRPPQAAAQPGAPLPQQMQRTHSLGTPGAVPHEHAEPLPKGAQFLPQHAQKPRASGSPASELLEASTQGSALQAEPLPKGTQFASELLEASTQGSALQAEPRANLG